MIPNYVTTEALDKIILDAIMEDLGDGDHSTLAVIPGNKTGNARLFAKENGIIAMSWEPICTLGKYMLAFLHVFHRGLDMNIKQFLMKLVLKK